MIKFIKQLFCNHEYVNQGAVDFMVNEHKCKKCGKIKHVHPINGNELKNKKPEIRMINPASPEYYEIQEIARAFYPNMSKDKAEEYAYKEWKRRKDEAAK